jgi:hypothetical protein
MKWHSGTDLDLNILVILILGDLGDLPKSPELSLGPSNSAEAARISEAWSPLRVTPLSSKMS